MTSEELKHAMVELLDDNPVGLTATQLTDIFKGKGQQVTRGQVLWIQTLAKAGKIPEIAVCQNDKSNLYMIRSKPLDAFMQAYKRSYTSLQQTAVQMTDQLSQQDASKVNFLLRVMEAALDKQA